LQPDSNRCGARATARDLLRGVMIACLVLVCLFAGGSPTGARPAPSLLNKKAPEFARSDLSGGRVDVGSYRGKVVLLNFWATWCAPCRVEMPVFAAWQKRYGPRGLQVVGISMDDDAAPVRRLAARLKLDYPIVMGDARLGEQYGGVLGLPITYLIGSNGVVRAEFEGEANLKAIEAKLTALLAAP
jgi:cytochrome c biogenesis protein CcmG, thiol:disulfide interchange protein DsbE